MPRQNKIYRDMLVNIGKKGQLGILLIILMTIQFFRVSVSTKQS